MKCIREILRKIGVLLDLQNRSVAFIWAWALLLSGILFLGGAWMRWVAVRDLQVRMDVAAKVSLAEHMQISKETQAIVAEMMSQCGGESGLEPEGEKIGEGEKTGESEESPVAPGDW